MSDSKGAAALRAMFKGVDETLDGEWVPKEGKYYAFDLPDEPGDFDERYRALCKLAALKTPGVVPCGHLRRSLRCDRRQRVSALVLPDRQCQRLSVA